MSLEGVDHRADASAASKPTQAMRPSPNKDWLRAIELTTTIGGNPSRLLVDVVQEWADKQGDRTALLSERETLTYRALTKRINQYARWALANGVCLADTVAL